MIYLIRVNQENSSKSVFFIFPVPHSPLPNRFLSFVARRAPVCLRTEPFSGSFWWTRKNIHPTVHFFPPCFWGTLPISTLSSTRAMPFSSNGSAFFTSKRVFHTHVTGSAKTDWKCARGRSRFPKYCRRIPRQRLKLQFKLGAGARARASKRVSSEKSVSREIIRV